jgi:hypothetical protein
VPLRRWALAALLPLAACGPEYREVVVRECLADGRARAYCECHAAAMKQALGPARYGVFTDLVLLGGSDGATRDDVLRLIDRHGLTLEELAATQAAINQAAPRAHSRCRG